jgi:hypothetical protein
VSFEHAAVTIDDAAEGPLVARTSSLQHRAIVGSIHFEGHRHVTNLDATRSRYSSLAAEFRGSSPSNGTRSDLTALQWWIDGDE